MNLEQRLGRSRETSPSEQRNERFKKLAQAIRRADSAEKIANMLKENELMVEIDTEKMRIPFNRDATTEKLLYDLATLPISASPDEDISGLQECSDAILDKLKEFGYQPQDPGSE